MVMRVKKEQKFYTIRCVIYARFSSRAQREVSIDQQLKACKAYAEAHGMEVVCVYTDHAMTGTNDRRPDFQQMIADSDNHTFEFVIVYALDRFARDRYDSAVYKRKLKNNGVRVLSATEPITDDPAGCLMESLLEGMAEYYSKELSRKIRRGMEDNADRCLANGSMPLGYVRSKDGHYIVDEAEAMVVQEIFARVAKGDAFADIINDLNARGIKTKKGGTWNKSSFGKLLSNERYVGTYIYKDKKVEGAIPAIIERELFDKVQYRMLNKANPRNNPQKRRRDNSVYLLTGKLFCGRCNSPMVGISGTAKSSRLYHYYVCQRKRKEHACDKAPVSREWAELEVATTLHKYVFQDEVIEWLADKAVEYQKKNGESVAIASLKAQLAEVQKSIKNVMAAIEQGIITPTTKERLMQLEAEEGGLKARLVMAESEAALNITKEEFIVLLRKFGEGDVKDKRYQEMLFDTFLIAAYLYDDHLRVVFNHSGKNNEVVVPFELTETEKEADTSMEVRIDSAPLHQSGLIRTPTIYMVAGLFVLVAPYSTAARR